MVRSSTSFLDNSLNSTPLKAWPYGTSVKPLGQGTPIKHQSHQAHSQSHSKQLVTPPTEGPRYNMEDYPFTLNCCSRHIYKICCCCKCHWCVQRYNLRRTPGRSSNSSATSSILQQESPEAFAKVVKKQLQVEIIVFCIAIISCSGDEEELGKVESGFEKKQRTSRIFLRRTLTTLRIIICQKSQ